MCGILGFVDFNGKSGQQVLEKMACSLPHRGPDGQGTYLAYASTAEVGLGHRRLSIIDLSSSANQPMEYNGLHVVFNGEIYNYAEIKNELVSLGHTFQTSSDTEVILHAWTEWGEKAIHKWRGMFAITLYDEKNQEVICIRDRAGVKPFFYYWKDDLFLFASELKSIVAHPDFPKRIDKDAVASYMQYGYVSHPHSIFQNTFKLPPGHLLRLGLSEKKISLHQYWNVFDFYRQPKLSIELPEAIEETERILSESFQYRMVADVTVGVFLSGGYDSTCVTALLQKNSTEKIKTFTIGMTDEKLNEAVYAKQVAGSLGTDHVEYYCTPKETLEIIPNLPYYFDEPFADSSAIPTILVSQLARKDVTVALSADGGDEIFAGYNRYDYVARYGKRLRSIPRPLRKAVVVAMENITSDQIPFLRNKRYFHSRYDKLKNFLDDPSPAQVIKRLTQIFSNKEIAQLFALPVAEITTNHTADMQSQYFDSLSYMMAVDYQTYMVDDVLQKVDRATMSVSLEGREPFLDQHIIEWAARMPSDYKYHKGQKKFLLKEIVHKYVPKEIMERPKMGFEIPLDEWLANELRDLVEENLSTASLQAHGLFNVAEVQAIVSEFFNGKKEKHLKVWNLLMFQLWYKRWMV